MTGLPDGWRTVSLDEVAEIKGGIQKQPKRAPRKNVAPFLRVANVTANGLDLTDVHEVELYGDELLTYRLERGDLLVVEGNGSASQIGRAAVWDGSVPGSVHQNHLIRVRPLSSVDPRYLGLVWNSPAVREELTAVSSSSSGLHTLSVRKLKRIELPIPGLREQRRIVEILEDHLSRLDGGNRFIGTAASRIIRMRQAARQQAVDAAGGLTVPLAELIDRIETGKSLGGSAAPAAEGEWGIIKVSAMTWGEFRPEENKRIPEALANPAYEIHPGDLLVSRANTSAYVGASVLVGDVRSRLLLSDKSLRLVPRAGVKAAWLNEVLQAPRSREQISALATGTKDSMRNISQKALLSIEVPHTPAEDQDRVLAKTRQMDDSVAVLDAAVARTRARAARLRQGLFAAAFSGKLTGSSSDTERIEELVEAGV